MTDLGVMGLLLGQMHRPLGQLHQPGGLRRRDRRFPGGCGCGPRATQYIEVHPTFLYESLWNLIGLLLILFVVSKGRRFDGENTWFYFLWYGLGRFWVEGLRTDSLYLFDWTFMGQPIRVSQALSVFAGGGGSGTAVLQHQNQKALDAEDLAGQPGGLGGSRRGDGSERRMVRTAEAETVQTEILPDRRSRSPRTGRRTLPSIRERLGERLHGDTALMDKALAAKVKAQAAEGSDVPSPGGPGLAVILVGNDPASRVYVTGKEKDCAECGFLSFEHALPEDTTQETLLDLIQELEPRPAGGRHPGASFLCPGIWTRRRC